MLDLLCLLGCAALTDLSVLSEGAQVQLTSDDLSVVLATAKVEDGELNLHVDLEPLSDIVLIISRPPPRRGSLRNVSRQSSVQIIKLNGFVSASAHDIMVQEPQATLSLKDWLQERDIALDVTP